MLDALPNWWIVPHTPNIIIADFDNDEYISIPFRKQLMAKARRNECNEGIVTSESGSC